MTNGPIDPEEDRKRMTYIWNVGERTVSVHYIGCPYEEFRWQREVFARGKFITSYDERCWLGGLG